MADIYKAKRGALVKDSSDTTPSIVRVEGFSGDNMLLLTGIQVERNQVTQYIKTLDNSTYGYTWGEGVGSIIVSGLIFFAANCGTVSGASAALVDQFYTNNNVYKKQSAIGVSIGSASYRGFLEGLQIGADQNEFNYGTFSFKFTIIGK